MAITDFDDISDLIAGYIADDAQTTGSVVDSVDGQETTYDLDNPDTFESDPTYDATGSPDSGPIIEFPTTRARLENTPMTVNDTGDITIAYAFQVQADAEYVLFHAGGFELLEIQTWDSGTDIIHAVRTSFSGRLEGPALVVNDWVLMVYVKNGTGSRAYWGSRTGDTDSNGNTSENLLDFTVGNYTDGQGAGDLAKKCFAVWSKELSDAEIDDVFDYMDELVNGASGDTLTATSVDASASFGAATTEQSLDPSSYDASVTFGAATTEQSVDATSHDASVAFGTHTQEFLVDAVSEDASVTFGSPQLNQSSSATSADFSPSFGSAVQEFLLDATSHDASVTFGAHTVSSPGVLAATSVDASAGFGAATQEFLLDTTSEDTSATFGSAVQEFLLDTTSEDASPTFGAASVLVDVTLTPASADFSATISTLTVVQGSVYVHSSKGSGTLLGTDSVKNTSQLSLTEVGSKMV